jgi:long-subunit acyl-CoA synthetase (AMP-forming)
MASEGVPTMLREREGVDERHRSVEICFFHNRNVVSWHNLGAEIALIDGEVCIRGDLVMEGPWKEAE